MYCIKCGNQLAPQDAYCGSCGAPVASAPRSQHSAPASAQPGDAQASPMRAAAQPQAPVYPVQDPTPYRTAPTGDRQPPSRHITLDPDGVYRWMYEYSLFKNPGLFFLIWKVFFFVALGIFAVMLIITAAQGDLDGERALDTLKYFGIATLVLTAVVGISYLIYAAIMGGKYIVIFEMDEKGINHKQIDKQAKKAAAIGTATFVIGAMSHNISGMAAGMNVRTEMYTAFVSTGKVKPFRRRNLIKIREILSSNQVFTYPEDFDFVLNYILARVLDKAKPKH